MTRACFGDGGEKRDTPCVLCRDIVQFYPLDVLLDERYPSSCYCLHEEMFWKIISNRPGGKKALRANSAKFLLCWLCGETVMHGAMFKECPLPQHIQKHLDAEIKLSIQTVMNIKRFEEQLDGLIALGFDPKMITEEEFHDSFPNPIGKYVPKPLPIGVYHYAHYWLRSTVEILAARGFPVDSITVIDDKFMSPWFPETTHL